MNAIDIHTLINWIVVGFIGFLFGTISSWVAYRYQKRRDDIAWEREKEKLAAKFKQDQELIEKRFLQRMLEIEEEIKKNIEHQKNNKIHEELLGGTIPPANVKTAVRMSEKEQTLPPVRRGRILDDDYATVIDLSELFEPDMDGWLIVKSTLYLQPGRIFKLVRGDTYIGRKVSGTSNGIYLNDERVSGEHARINFLGEQISIVDLQSTNGTFVNGQRIVEPTIIHENDEIKIGGTVFILKTALIEKRISKSEDKPNIQSSD